MAVLLAVFLVAALVGLGFLGFHTLELSKRVAHRDGELRQWNDHFAAAKTQYDGLVNKYNEDIAQWKNYSESLKVQVQRLAKWKTVVDAEAKAEELTRAAQAIFNKAKTDAENLTSTAQQQAAAVLSDANNRAAAQVAEAASSASSTLSEARQQAKQLRDESQRAFDSATTQAARIVEAAKKKAEEIAGSAYEAMTNASLYERTVRAMKNLIEGYGDEYIVPPHSLLDDLADDFQHAQAGQQLKNARERTKVMIRNGTAAACDYAEATRRETAVSFVIDAFNGKADSILSRVKHDNAGKLAQEIRDALTLVNYNGKAFRNARITEEYLGARLDELKWAAIVQQLAVQDRDEQRRAKEQAREEAKAEKERARALREAAKEEETLRKAMEQAREQFEQASGEQKAKYEERLQEMAERLRQAEERKQRAVSMAQQTKKGHVYIISNIGSFGEDVYKIGLTRRWDPVDRVRELGDASVPFGFDVHAMILSEDAPALEKQLHQCFLLMQLNKVNFRKEFFRVNLRQIRAEIEKLGLTGVQWTTTAVAKEYRETLATERAIKDDPKMREAWIKRQLELDMTDDGVLEPFEYDTEDE
jgi:hypothetical protein